MYMANLAASTVDDSYGTQYNFLFNGDMSIEGYFQVSVDNRGTPSLRGAHGENLFMEKSED